VYHSTGGGGTRTVRVVHAIQPCRQLRPRRYAGGGGRVAGPPAWGAGHAAERTGGAAQQVAKHGVNESAGHDDNLVSSGGVRGGRRRAEADQGAGGHSSAGPPAARASV
jgi:hypothetical protein